MTIAADITDDLILRVLDVKALCERFDDDIPTIVEVLEAAISDADGMRFKLAHHCYQKEPLEIKDALHDILNVFRTMAAVTYANDVESLMKNKHEIEAIKPHVIEVEQMLLNACAAASKLITALTGTVT